MIPVEIRFSEKPATAEEKEIANLLQSMALAIQQRDYTGLKNLHRSWDASEPIIPLENRHVERIKKSEQKLKKITFDNILIRIMDDSHGVVSFERRISKFGKLIEEIETGLIKVQKIEGSWHIMYPQ